MDTIRASGTKNAYLSMIEKSHSSIIKYEYFQTEDINWYFDLKSWKGIKSLGLVKKTIVKRKETSTEIRYYISSLYLDIKMSIKIQCSNCKNEKLISRKIIQNLDEKTFKDNPIFKCNKCNIRMYPIIVEVDY